ncbi:hypothetical protein ACIA8K_07075 [Catenuloplanes sp. NPDC051500]|uniref:hypothetical protein n=1 Tax=Catenuloplanes sp. NPDC051500 TaxID=3363959 RepID=UPI0037B04028
MRVLLEIGLAAGVEFNPQWLILDHPTQGLLDTHYLAPDDALADYSHRLMSVTVERSSTRSVGPLIEYNAGTCTATVVDFDGSLDPSTLEAAGIVVPGVMMRVRVEHGGLIYPIWSGFVDSMLPSTMSPEHSVVTITGTDGMSRLTRYKRPAGPAVGAGENTGARIHRILDSAGWPAARRSIGTGASTLQATTLEGIALDEAQQANLNEIGEFYVNASGDMVFRGRNAVITDTRSAVSQGVFGSGAGELPYVGRPGLSSDIGQLRNRIVVTREGGGTLERSDLDSIDRNGDHPYEEMLTVTDDDQAAGWAGYVLAQTKAPEFRFTTLTIDTRARPDALIPHAVGREIGDRITVVRRAPGGIVDARDVYIRSISHTWTGADRWTTNWGLQPTSKYPFLILDHPTQGLLDVNYLAY